MQPSGEHAERRQPRRLAGIRGHGRRPLCSNGAETGAFVKTSPELPAPDVQFHFLPLGFVGPDLRLADFHSFAIAPTLLRPKSTGSISLRSADSLSPPRIEPNYLMERDDLEVLIEGVQLTRQVIRSGAFNEFGFEEYLPEPGQERGRNRDPHPQDVPKLLPSRGHLQNG